MNILIFLIIILLISFLWAYLSLKNELSEIKKGHEKKSQKNLSGGEEIVLFDRSKRG